MFGATRPAFVTTGEIDGKVNVVDSDIVLTAFVLQAMRVRQRAGLAVEPTDEAAFYRACLSGDFEEAAEVGTRFLEAGKYVNKTTILALLKAYTMRGDSDRGLELLLFLDSLGWRLQSVQPR